MRKRVLSLLLAMIMIFSLMPNVFAVHSNTDTGDSYIPLGGSVGGWGDKAGNHMGMRFSLYFAEGDWSSYEEMKQAESNNQLVWEKKGDTLEVVQKGMDNVTWYSRKTIYEKMMKDSAMEDDELKPVDWSSTAVPVSNIPTPNAFPTILYDDSNTDKKKWQTYFCGYSGEDIDEVWQDETKVHFENLDPILDLMTKDLGWQNIDFRNGRYTTNSGATKNGVFKLYFEPTTQITINNVSNAMTLRDLIAFYNSHKNLYLTGTYNGEEVQWPVYTAFRSLSLTMANATRLSEDEPAINMSGYTQEGDIKSNSNFGADGDLYKSGGVGVLTGFPRGPIAPEVKVVTSYIKITGYNEKGEAIYVETEKAEDTKVEMVKPDNEGRIKIAAEKQKGATQYKLNDVFVTQKDIIPSLRNSTSKEVEWVNAMPENIWTKAKVDKSFTDIDGYIENIVLNDVKFQEEMGASTHTISDTTGALMLAFTNLGAYMKFLYTTGLVDSVSRMGKPATTLSITQGTVEKSTDVEKELVEKLPYLVDDLSAVPVTEKAKNDAVALTFGEDNVTSYNAMKEDYKKTNTDAFLNKYGAVLPAYGVTVPEGVYYSPKTNASATKAEEGSLESIIYLRYIVIPTPHQVNILIKKENNVEKEREIVSVIDLVPENNKISLRDIREDGYPEARPINYWTNTTFEKTDPYKVPPSDKVKEGKEEEVKQPIFDMPLEETVYVFWEIDEETPPPQVDSGYIVPQWRLSKYWTHLKDDGGNDLTGSARMSFSVSRSSCDCGCSPYLSGSWSYTMVNPNGSFANSGLGLVDQMKYKTYLHSKTLNEGKISYPSLGSPRGMVSLSGDLNAIKSTDKTGLKLATWLNPALSEYDIEGSTNPLRKSEGVYNTSDTLPYGFYNTNNFYNGYYVCGCYDEEDEDGGSTHVHECGFGLNVIGPSSPSYTKWKTGINITFNRYNQQAKDKLKVDPIVSVENGLTTLKYQLTDNLSVYPEYGMLFQSDDGHNDLKWVVGDENRQINPVVYQTLQHKVYVSAVSSGTSVATDSRAITNAQKLGEGNKQVIYKGSAIGNAFTLHQDSSKQSAALLTVKTYALDINTKNADLKSAWEDSNYHSDKQHEVLINSLNGQKAKYDEKLLIDSPNYGNLDYTGGSITTNTYNKYELRNYSGSQVATKVPLAVGGNAIVLEHELIVRGGKLVAVRVKDTNGGTTLKSIEQLRNEGKDSKTSLYAALINMHLIDEGGNRANTVFTAFEHLTGDVLTEQEYATLLNNGRNAKDGYNSTSEVGVSVGQGWYSEDTTVLVVKEYISNLTVPSVSVTDKIALSVNGLVTPQNKAQFFSTMGKGYLYLNYDLTCKDPNTGSTTGVIYKTLPEIHSGFTFTSFPNDEYAFGEQQVNYLVPNVSITDTTRLN